METRCCCLNEEKKAGRGKLLTINLLYNDGIQGSGVGKSEQNTPKDDQRSKRGSGSRFYQSPEQLRVEERDVKGDKQQKRGDDEHAQRKGASERQEQDQNRRSEHVTTQRDVGAVKRAKAGHEHIQRADSSLRQAGLAGSSIVTENRGDGSVEKSQPSRARTQDTGEMLSPGGFPPATTGIYNDQCQDAVKRRQEVEWAAAAGAEALPLIFTDKMLDGNEVLLSEFGIQHMSVIHMVVKGIYKFKCPALVEDYELCNELWSYQEVRRLADLSSEEMQHFEDTMARLAAADYCEIQTCPQCKTSVERKDLSNLCVRCTMCTADQKKACDFCWQCQRKWKGPGPRSDRCDNDGCINRDLQLLQTCKTIGLPAVKGVTSCPSVRVCPTCGMKVEHSQQYCKNIICPRCQSEFCFVCLKLKRECIKTSSPYEICPSGVAPRQTSIPVWKRK